MLGKWEKDGDGLFTGPRLIQNEDCVQTKGHSRWSEKMRARWDLLEYIKVCLTHYLQDRSWGLKILARIAKRKKKGTSV